MHQLKVSTAVQSVYVSGPCFESVIDLIEGETTAISALRVRKNAEDIVQHATNSYCEVFGEGEIGEYGTGLCANNEPEHPIGGKTNGLMYGKVQSGKTNASIATVALANDNGFKCFVVLTSDNVWLGKQTADRFRDQLIGGPKVDHWENWKSDPKGAGAKLAPYMRDTGVLLVTTKNKSNLENLKAVLKSAGAKDVPGMILDDEADNASLNTNTAKQALGHESADPSAIFSLIGEVRQAIPHHIFIQITATPQSLLLQGLDHPLRPAWHVLVEPGENYIGGDKFFGEDSPYIKLVDAEEMVPMRAGRISPGSDTELPQGLSLALACFLIGSTSRQLTEKKRETHSMLIHVDHKKVAHESIVEAVQAFLRNMDQSLRGKESASRQQSAERLLKEAYDELALTCDSMPTFDEVLKRLHIGMRNASASVVNSDSPAANPEYRIGMNILVGGNRLGRGVTIKGLMVTYYGRDAKTKMTDTVHQHARMFGYRKNLLPYTRLFSAEHIVGALEDIHQSDEGTREALSAEGDLVVKPVWVGPALKPTRANVLNPADITAVVGGREIWPAELNTSKREVGHLISELDDLLANFADGEFHLVNVSLMQDVLRRIPSHFTAGRTWTDKRVQQILAAISSSQVGITDGLLRVDRGKNSLGYEIHPEKAIRSGFLSGAIRSEVRGMPKSKPILILRKQSAALWNGCAVYAPTLIIPETKFAFLFQAS